MLDLVRSNKSSFAVIAGAVAVVFILWTPGMSMGTRVPLVARVNGKAVTENQFYRAVDDQLEQMRRFTGRKPSEADQKSAELRVLDNLIEQELMVQEAARLGVVVSDRELQKEIIQKPYFLDDNKKFDLKKYQKIVRRYPMFEDDERKNLTLIKLDRLIRDGVEVSDADLWDKYERQNTKVNVEYVKFDKAHFEKDLQFSDDEKTTYLKDHLVDAQARYDRDFDRRYNSPKKVKASHILLKFGDTDDDATKATTRQKMEQIKTMAATGDFADLAKRYSEDPGSTAKGGDLGYFDEKRMDPAFSAVAFALPVGQISDIVESKFGLHIIKVEEIQDAKVTSFEDVKNDIAADLLKEQKAPELAKQAAEQLKDAWVAKAPDLETKLKEKGLSIQETGLTTRGGNYIRGIGSSPELTNVISGMSPLDPPSDRIFDVDGSSVYVRVKERQSADPAAFEKEKDNLRRQIRREKEQQLFDGWVDTLKVDAKIERLYRFGTSDQPAS